MSDDSSCSGSPSTQPSLSEYNDSSCDDYEYETNSEPEVESESVSGSQNPPRNYEREIHDDDSNEDDNAGDDDCDNDGDNEEYVSQFYDLDLDPKRTDLSDHDSDDDWATQGYDQASSKSTHNSNTASENTDLNINEWCRCEECAAVHSKDQHNYCCNESDAITDVRQEMSCITKTTRFMEVVENKDILKLLRYTYAKGNSKYLERNLDNRQYRHLCYKFFVFLINCHSSVNMTRYILPSCVIKRIRELYPEFKNTYTGFKEGTGSTFSYKEA